MAEGNLPLKNRPLLDAKSKMTSVTNKALAETRVVSRGMRVGGFRSTLLFCPFFFFFPSPQVMFSKAKKCMEKWDETYSRLVCSLIVSKNNETDQHLIFSPCF